jgi:hypothetical protein
MAWDFCADPDFEPTLDWVRSFVDDELRPIEPLLPHLSRTLSPQRGKRSLTAAGQGIANRLPREWTRRASRASRKSSTYLPVPMSPLS